MVEPGENTKGISVNRHERRRQKKQDQTAAKPSAQARARLNAGVMAYGEDRIEEAEAAFRKVLAEYPREAQANYYLGLIECRRGNLEAAADLLVTASLSDDEDPAIQPRRRA